MIYQYRGRRLHEAFLKVEDMLMIELHHWKRYSPQMFLYNSTALSSGGEDKPALKEVLKMLSRFLQKKGELTKTRLEASISFTSYSCYRSRLLPL
jgi:hypothetical protein